MINIFMRALLAKLVYKLKIGVLVDPSSMALTYQPSTKGYHLVTLCGHDKSGVEGLPSHQHICIYTYTYYLYR